MQEEEEIPLEAPKEKKRSRKKLLYCNIKNLMEFYFSAANLTKDRWLSQNLEAGSIELTHFLNFNKVRALTNDVNDIVKALRTSEILEVSDDCKVRRSVPLEIKENLEDYVIYVEQIPSDANHEWLKNYFSCYGPIDYISLPRYSTTNKCKGFAFIEFRLQASAEKAIEDYKKAGRYLSNNIEPQELLSISTFEKKGSQMTNLNAVEIGPGQVESESSISINRKRKTDMLEENLSCEGKKHKMMDEEEECEDNLASHIVEVANPTVLDDTLNSEGCSEGNVDESRKKKNRKKKKKTKKNKFTPETTGFQILSKKDWKYLRNKYLNIQRDKMKQLKKHLRQKQREFDYKNHSKKNEKLKENNNENEISRGAPSKEFVPGVIVKVEFSEPIINLKQFKAEVKSKSDNVKYVDVKEGSFDAFIRLITPEAAKEFCEKSSWNSADILKGDEENDYWKKLEDERQKKLTKLSNRVKERGRDKMLKKAEKVLGQHLTFGEDDHN